jgi:hypothetical protein
LLISWANRRRVRTIVWNDTVGGYLPSYPWEQFVTTLRGKAALAGMQVLLAREATPTDVGSTIGHLQAEARARPGTPADRDRYWERAEAPEITGRLPRRLRGDRNRGRDGHPTVEERSSGRFVDASLDGGRGQGDR